jgi:hypothetical protein
MGLASLAGWVKLSQLRLKTESLVAKPAKPVAESNTSSESSLKSPKTLAIAKKISNYIVQLQRL